MNDLTKHPRTSHVADEVRDRRNRLEGSVSQRQERLSDEQRVALRRARVAAVWVGLVLPVVIALGAAAVLIAWLPFTPNPVATHWSGGVPDGFSAPAVNLMLGSGLGIGVALLLGLPAVLEPKKNSLAVWSAMNRFLAASSLMMAISMALLVVFSTHIQLGLSDARDAGSVTSAAALACGIGAAVGVVGYLVQPKVYIAGAEGVRESIAQLSATERAVWLGSVRPSRALGITLTATMTVLVGAAVAMLLSGAAPAVVWLMGGLILLLAVLFACSLWFRVRIDAAGLEVRSVAGWPVFRVPASDVAHAVSSQISPMSDFGGWGLRWTLGGFGIVMRTGEGLTVTRKNGRIFALTIDGSATAAGLLEAYAHEDGNQKQ